MAYSYAQLEGIWIQAGGDPKLAPLMAAIAEAESSGNPNSLNETDNGGTQTSWGLWQISNGDHSSPSPNWNDPVTNAKLAMGKLNSQGLRAWGTYTSGAYRQYMNNSTTPDSNIGPIPNYGGGATASPVSLQDETCAWKIHFPVAGDTCLISKKQLRTLLGTLVIGGAIVVGLVGAVVLVAYGTKAGSLGGAVPTVVTRMIPRPSKGFPTDKVPE